MRLILLALIAFSAVASGADAQKPEGCPALKDTVKADLVRYVHARYRLSDTVPMRLTGEATVPGTCYRLLTFEGASSLKKWHLKLYLSPDARYLTSDLLDTSVDPTEEERARMAALMAGLSQNKGASIGADDAPVTIVVFSDFQCPYCRKFDAILHEILQSQKEDVRVVFHHMPLSMHSWARTAAEAAACAQVQSSKAFWAIESKIFANQSSITPENVSAKLVEISRGLASLDPAAFQTCMDNDMSLGLLFRDVELASSNGVNGTPTLFVNGRRMEGVRDAAQLRELIAEAKGSRQEKANGPMSQVPTR